MKALIACECSGTVRDAFAARDGWEAWSCDLLPSEKPGNHYEGDVMDLLADDMDWDIMIAHPVCRFLCSSGLHWNIRRPGRAEKTEKALTFVRMLMDAPIQHIAIENPVGCIGTRIRPADQYIQPHEFGHDASKRTGLWLKGLPKLVPTGPQIQPRMVHGRPRWGNQTDSGQNRLGPSANRWMERARTYRGIAQAMAAQWGAFIEREKA